MPSEKPQIDLNAITEQDLLQVKLCDLPITIAGTWLEECIQTLYKELADKGLNFKPECYLADEWLTPEHEPVIGIPFYLAHPTLIKLERKMMLEAEGDTKEWCMKLLRHEAGHAICYAFKLNEKEKWQKMFGLSSKDYGDTYRYQPYSKRFVRHLDGFYAQYHPDEDFVETFAVWLTPDSDWQERYKNWKKAFDKLKYVDELMTEIKGLAPLVRRGSKFYNLKSLKITFANFYKKKKVLVEEDFPDFHDRQLKKIFKSLDDKDFKAFQKLAKKDKDLLDAAGFLRKYQSHIVYNVARTTGERRYIVNDLLKTIIRRCRQLNMVIAETDTMAAFHISTYVTSLVMNYTHTGWFGGKRHKRTS